MARDQVGVVEAQRDVGLLFEAREPARVELRLGLDDLDGDVVIGRLEARGLEHPTKATGAEEGLDLPLRIEDGLGAERGARGVGTDEFGVGAPQKRKLVSTEVVVPTHQGRGSQTDAALPSAPHLARADRALWFLITPHANAGAWLLSSAPVGVDERALLTAWQAGDRLAAQTLVRRHWSDVLRFFLAVTKGDRADAEELTQDTFTTVVRRRDDIRSSFRAYCYGVARMKRFERRRDWQRNFIELDELELEPAPSADEGERVRAKLVITVLRRMPADDQLLLVLKDYLGFTQPELAETFKIQQSRVAGRINRARRRFRQEFARLELAPDERELTMRSLDSALRSIVARLPEELGLDLTANQSRS